MNNQMYSSIYDFEPKFRQVDKMPYKPMWEYPKTGTVYDENKSVKWNREECERKQRMWSEEKSNNEIQRLLAKNKIELELINYIVNQIDITETAARRLWERSDHDLNKCECLMDDYIYIKEVDIK